MARAHALSNMLKKWIPDLLDTVVEGDKKTLANFTSDNFWKAVNEEEASIKAGEQLTGSVSKERESR